MKHALNGYNSIAVLNAELALPNIATPAATGFPVTSSAPQDTLEDLRQQDNRTIRAKALAKKHAPLIVGALHPNNAERIYAAIEAAVVEALS